jgi:hypothetical protein
MSAEYTVGHAVLALVSPFLWRCRRWEWLQPPMPNAGHVAGRVSGFHVIRRHMKPSTQFGRTLTCSSDEVIKHLWTRNWFCVQDSFRLNWFKSIHSTQRSAEPFGSLRASQKFHEFYHVHQTVASLQNFTAEWLQRRSRERYSNFGQSNSVLSKTCLQKSQTRTEQL